MECPTCHSENIKTRERKTKKGEILVICECDRCGFQWTAE